ncbi:stage II sporulation protein M [Clostridium sp. CAG:440]|jgi:stage II sporulation protein M|nr:stage II sporulation protein M [Clostridium sp. CAG:440]HJJ15941.1 stage II sporulation protein M [Clostridiaceae bacterium]
MKNIKKTLKLKDIIVNHIASNSKEYIIVTLLFIIGIFLGVLFVNNIKNDEFDSVQNYITTFIQKFKENPNIDSGELLKTSIIKNLILALSLWFFGTTVIGIPIVFGILIYRGFCLGYTISTFISTIGIAKGLAFVFSNMLLQTVIFIPAILAISVSGFKLYKSIVKDKRKENVKIEIIRHTIFSALMTILLCLSSVVEVFVSNNLLKIIVKYL